MKPIKISEAEWQVMNVVWKQSPITAGEIVSILEARAGWRPRTTRTLLGRLAEKGALRVLSGGKLRYEPKVTMEDCMRHESRTFIERVFGGEPASMLLHVMKETKLTRDEIEQLKKLLMEKEK